MNTEYYGIELLSLELVVGIFIGIIIGALLMMGKSIKKALNL